MFEQYTQYQQPYSPNAWNGQYLSQQRVSPMQPMTAPVQGLVRVTGMDGARAYQMAPNSVAALFDANDDVFFVKSTDGAGFPTIRAFRFTPIEQTAPKGGYVTQEEFDKFKEAVLNAQQFIRKQPAGNAGPADGQQPSGPAAAVQPVPAADGR